MAVQTVSHNDVKTDRHLFIGGSDIASVMGMSRYKTPLRLWAEKTGRIEQPDLTNNEAVETGIKLEQFVADMFAEKTGKTVRRAPKKYTHPKYSYMAAHIDRLITGTDELLECKTCSAFRKNEWDGDEIPKEYILQVIWYLGITGRKTGYIAVLIGGQSFKYKKIEFDEELFNSMVDAAVDFWTHVQNDTPPDVMADDDDTLKDLYPNNNGELVDLTASDDALVSAFNDAVSQRQELKMHEKLIKEELIEIENRIKDVIKENEGVITDKFIVTWKTRKGQFIYDKQKMLDDGIFGQYATQNTVRVLNIKKQKESEAN